MHALALALVILSLAGAGPATAQDREFTPVTDAMLADPDPADWINWRRTLDGWGYSPLDRIDRDNVHQLGLVWSWTMPTGLAQPTPIVYDGVMYLPSPLNVVQGARRRHGRSDLGVPQALRAVTRRFVPRPHPGR